MLGAPTIGGTQERRSLKLLGALAIGLGCALASCLLELGGGGTTQVYCVAEGCLLCAQ